MYPYKIISSRYITFINSYVGTRIRFKTFSFLILYIRRRHRSKRSYAREILRGKYLIIPPLIAFNSFFTTCYFNKSRLFLPSLFSTIIIVLLYCRCTSVKFAIRENSLNISNVVATSLYRTCCTRVTFLSILFFMFSMYSS